MRRSSPARPIAEGLLQSGPAPIWLLDLTIAGRTHRYSTRVVQVTWAGGGETYDYRGGLPAVQVEERADILAAGSTPIAPRVSLDLLPDEDLAALVEQGHRLDTIAAEMSWWVPGTDYDQREVILQGRLRGPSYGAYGEPLSVTIEPELPDYDRPILSATARVSYEAARVSSGSAWQDSAGLVRPLVVGSPGDTVFDEIDLGYFAYAIGRSAMAHECPIWTVNDGLDPAQVNRVLLTDGHWARPGQIRLRIDDRDDGGSAKWFTVDPADINRITTGDNEPVTLINVSNFLSGGERTARTFYAAWAFSDRTSQPAAGLPDAAYDEVIYTESVSHTSFPVTDPVLFDGEIGGVIVGITVSVTVAFDSGVMEIGDSRDQNRYMNSSVVDLTTVGTYAVTAPQDIAFALPVVLATIGAPTTGEATVTVTYQPASTSAVETLGQAMAWAAERTRAAIDRASWVSMRETMQVPVSGVIDDADMTYWQLLREHLIPLAPVSLRWGAAGIRPVVWPWLGLRGRSVRSLTHGEAGVVRLPGVEYSTPSEEMISACRVRYGWDAKRTEYRSEISHVAQGREMDDPTSVTGTRLEDGSGQVEVTDQHFGPQQVDVVESRWIYASQTARWVARWRLALLGAGYRQVRIEGPPDLGALDVGSVVDYTDAGLSMAAAPAVVVGRRLTDVGRVGLDLALTAGVSTQSMSGSTDRGSDRPDGPAFPQA